MHDEASLLALEIAEEMDRQMPGYAFSQRMQRVWNENLLRLLRYLCDGDVPNIAQRHRDKSFLTIHIGSDRGGLWLADNRDTILADAGETQTDSVLIFLSRKAWEITRGTLKGIIHGVRDTTFPSLLGRMPRHTAVGFFHAEVSGDERAWAAEHMHELSIPEHVKRFELS
jgi:isopenicillin N synthase-like dioxygenase